MKKISVYIGDDDYDRLRHLALTEGRSLSAIVRAALIVYENQRKPGRKFAIEGAWEGDGTSVADIPEEELLRGFGELSEGNTILCESTNTRR